MFEKIFHTTDPFGNSHGMHDCGNLLIGNAARSLARGGGALRALEWSEVTARLNAARDLRHLMRREFPGGIEVGAASFGDAAATYFSALDQGERPVNHDALEASKASSCIGPERPCDAATGDARDN